jgi:colicin import membrane protein
MSRPGITYDQVAHAADTLLAGGRNPTINGVRDALGDTGSPNTIHKHLTTWRSARPQSQAVARELPSKIIDAINAQIEQATASARAEVEGLLVQAMSEAADLAVAGAAMEIERDALAEQLAVLTTERDTIVGRAVQQLSDLADANERIERERKLAGDAQTEAAMTRIKIEGHADKLAEQARALERLREELAASQQARHSAEQAAAVIEAKLEGCKEARTAAEQREQDAQAARQRAEKETKQVQGAEQQANLSVQACQARLEAVARELDDLRKQTKEAREQSKKDGEIAAELRGRLASMEDNLMQKKQTIADKKGTT